MYARVRVAGLFVFSHTWLTVLYIVLYLWPLADADRRRQSIALIRSRFRLWCISDLLFSSFAALAQGSAGLHGLTRMERPSAKADTDELSELKSELMRKREQEVNSTLLSLILIPAQGRP